MQMNFDQFSAEVAASFQRMTATGLFSTAADKDRLWETYLGSFAPGTNPIYKVRAENDCSACRYFIRTLGGVVTTENATAQTAREKAATKQRILEVLARKKDEKLEAASEEELQSMLATL